MENKVLILCYHHVAKTAGDHPMKRYYVDPALFAAQMKFLKDKAFNVVGLDHVIENFLAGKGMPPKTLAITFDDGYKSFSKDAYPVLKEQCFEAAVFIPTGRIGATNDWDGIVREDSDIMTLGEMKALAAEGMSFHSHGVSHPRLPDVPEDMARKELGLSRKFITEQFGGRRVMFSYPFSSVSGRTAKLAAEEGYPCAFTADYGANVSTSDMFRLRRVQIFHDDIMPRFAFKIYYGFILGETAGS